jgi:exopolysaccharide biosynthesis polyprenyl glycosylphosphotransferase
MQILHEHGVDSVLVAASAMQPHELNQLTRELLDGGIHVHLSSGLAGIAPQRLRSLPLGHEPLFYLEHWRHSPVHLMAKRALDLVLASLAVVLLSPLLLFAVVVIKLGDRGPILYRHQRVGLGGKPFTCYKFRTMYVDSDSRQDALHELNVRKGPLFKVRDDPRVIPGGRFLRNSSIDELPQLFNVINGTMSLVGPRPALPREHDAFDDELHMRIDVRPGITGLWQVEARDNPEFSAYRRLDLFYIENWSIGLDFAILLRTLPLVLMRALPSRMQGAPADEPRVATVVD